MKKFLLLLALLLSSPAYADDIYFALDSGRQTVTSNGTEVQLSSTSIPCKRVIVQAETDNTNPVTVGGSDVVGALATRQGIALTAGSAITIRTNDVSNIWIDSVTDTEGVTWLAFK